MRRVRPSEVVRATIITCVPAAKTYVGIVHDNEGPRPFAATQCAVIRSPKYTLQTDTEAWVLTDEQLAGKYAGKKVVVRGTVKDGNRLEVYLDSIG